MSSLLAECPSCYLCAGGFQNPFANMRYKAGLFCQGDELAGGQYAAARMVPANERFDAQPRECDRPAAGSKARTGRCESAETQIFLERGASVDRGLQGGREKSHGISARGLRLIHGNIGLLQDFVRAFAAIAENGNADAGAAAALAPLQGCRTD